ncbi:hypothetical protein [Streptomyces sp. NPDC088789]|uniref:hypothetical protein n=1 Tax=Streptomyces sp. NPDC088789 TaxID=3365899 RepID=UPI00381714C0
MNSSGIRHSRPHSRPRPRRHPRLRAVTPAVAALVSLALLTACGGSGDGNDGKDGKADGGSRGSGAAAEGVQPLTAAELEKAALKAADLPGYQVAEAPDSDISAAEAAKVDEKDCLQLGRAVAGTTAGAADAAVHRRVTGGAGGAGGGEGSEEASTDINTGMVTLASYQSADDAAETLKSLGDAVTACKGGFEWTVGGEKLTASKVTEDTAPKGGEDAVAFTAFTKIEGAEAPWKAVVFRQGATLAHFTLVNAAAIESGKDFPFPADLVTAQADKLT